MAKSYDLVVRNGTVVTASERMECDIGVRAGRIAALAERLGPAPREIDARGMLVLPGGIDSHCHIEQKSSTGLTTADDFTASGIAAACGGTTTLMPFVAAHRGQSMRAEYRRYLGCALERSVVDFAFHVIVSETTGEILERDLPDIIREGSPSFKIYTTYDSLKLNDGQILDLLELARREGALAMVHAENSDAIAWRTRQLVRTGQISPRFHALSRPLTAEREATHRVISLAEMADVPILIVHVSAEEAFEQIRWARDRGLPVFAETCPQYAVLTERELDRPGFEGAKYICSPPLRSEIDRRAVWDALIGDVVQVFSSDHAPYRFDSREGKQAHGADAPFHKIPNGMPGLETRLPILFSEGVGNGRIDIHRFVALAATNAARIYGLFPRKGTIAIGSDADLALWDPAREVTITHDILHDTMDYTPYEGMKVTGWPVTTLSRGEILWENGEVRGRPGRGLFVARAPGAHLHASYRNPYDRSRA
jgi:dihydropyrimidinase